MAGMNGIQPSSDAFIGPQFTSEHQLILLNTEELRTKNREQLIEKLERVIQEKNASITKLEERELYLEDTLKKRNTEFRALEEQLRQFEEKTRTFEQLHQLQVHTFEKTIRDCQIENERLCEHANDLTKQLREKSNYEVINKERILTFDRIAADTQLWRQKLDSYKAAIEERDETIANLKKEINDVHKQKQTNTDFEDNSQRLQTATLQTALRERDNEIEHLKLTLLHVRDKLATATSLSNDNRWRSSEDIGRNSPIGKTCRSSSSKTRCTSPPVRDYSSSSALDTEYLKTKIRTLTDRLANVQQLLVQRDEQINTLKKVHDKRWLRLKHLQKQYRSLKDELQSYIDDESCQKKNNNDYFYGKVIRKNKTGCTVCDNQRRRKQIGTSKKIFKNEDDDGVWNEVTKLRRDNARLINENLSLNEKLDLQEVEINEQTIVINELRNEIQLLNDKDERSPLKIPLPLPNRSNDNEQRVIEEYNKKLYEHENERTYLVFEHERLKTNLDLCIDEKQHLMQQRTQATNEIKKLKLRILSLQDQVHKLKRNNQPVNKRHVVTSSSTLKRRLVKKKPKASCLEVLLDQNQSSTFIDDLHNESSILYRMSPLKSDVYDGNRWQQQRQRTCSLCDYHTQASLMKRKRRPSMTSTISKRKNIPSKKNHTNRSRLVTSFHNDSYSHRVKKPSIPSTAYKNPTRIGAMRRRIEQLEMILADSKEENQQLHQRLSTTLSRINILKTTNQRLIDECDKFKNNRLIPSTLPGPEIRRNDSLISDGGENVDNLYSRLKNTSFDASRQRKLNKTLQTDNENLTKNLQSLTEKLTHTERDVASKRVLIENYKSRLSELETSLNRSNDKLTTDNDEERLKSLTDTMEKLRVSLDSYKNRLQVVAREKQTLETRYGQLVGEHEKLKIRLEDIQTKHRSTEQQLRQCRLNQEQLNQELLASHRLSEQQLLSLNTKNQDSLSKITFELNRTQRRLNEYERFTNGLLHEMVRRSIQMHDTLKRAREHQRQRESFSMTLPGYDTAMNTASKILNLTQDDLDDIMSTTDESFQAHSKHDNMDKNEKIRQKVSKLLASQEEFSGKLLKIFSKKLDEIQAADRDLATMRNI
ncbi:unnamed protein product [Rotaria magnacalcarata]|uniref:Centlein n=1 Tax=Rotaria magnacalcarata TaxID=392030 RepID=A0A817AFB3_9BILA|nr:unnamed protein product [Rotaria magnacalcarata]